LITATTAQNFQLRQIPAKQDSSPLITMSSAQQIQQHPVFIQAHNKAQYYVNQFDKEVPPPFSAALHLFFNIPQLSKYPILTHLEQHTQVPKTYAVLGALFLITVLHTINPLAAPVSNLVGWALPAYLSFKALETPSPHDDIQWLTYWAVFGFFNFLESFAIRLVLYYVPWYYAFKTIFIVWLQLPAFRVSNLHAPCVSFAYSAFLGCTSHLSRCPQTCALQPQ